MAAHCAPVISLYKTCDCGSHLRRLFYRH
uniref:Uncharacterized protein n=1 Tax=Anguilla anguilla TaxID=7936 RepID=A0A0E9S6N0_ANGAN